MKDHYSRSVTNAGAFDYLSTHFVVTDDRMVRDNPPPDFISQADFALPVGLERKLRQMTKQIEADSQARDRVKIAFTEWLFWASKGDVPRYDNMGGAICTAGFLNMLLRVADIVPISDRKKRGRVLAAPSYWAFRMYSNADTSQPVEARTQAAQYNVEEGSARLPAIPDVPYLDVVAALNDTRDKLTLFCVNRHLTQDIAAQISITGFVPGADGLSQTLSSSSIYDKNDEAHPEAVLPQKSRARMEDTFRRESVTVLQFRKGK